MCGLVGIFDLRGAGDIDRELLSRMNESQFHRGPDEGGLHVEPGVGLGHRRLSIIDLANGRQPLFNEDHSVVVVYNGEIYNFPELAVELAGLGHVFRTHCDTEVIVHAWEEWGEACVERFRGMFAFALWDRNRQTLFLARDRLGIKPLYYAELDNGQLIFASELKALQCHPGLSRDIDPQAVEEYFCFGYVPEPRSIYRQAKKLPPGHLMAIRRDNPLPVPREYWDVPFAQHAPADEAELQEELIARMKEAVRIRLVSEVPLGAFLSGGVDSSAVVALMAQLEPGKAVNTCSIGFGDPKFNETEFARQVAERYHTDHHVEQVEADDFDLLDTLAGLYDEPFADSSAIPTYRVCELAKRQVTVALSGDGGDENFAGYSRYRWYMKEEPMRRILPPFLRRPLFGLAGALYPGLSHGPGFLRLKPTLQSLAQDDLGSYMANVGLVPEGVRQGLYSNAFIKTLGGYHAHEVCHAHLRKAPTDHPLSQLQYLDMKTYLAGDILTKVDRASMAHALEVRVPILDHRFVEWASGLPPGMKLRGGEGKWLFKKALEPHVPNDVLYRRKMGFAVPLNDWLRGPLRERLQQMLRSQTLADTGVFDVARLKRLVDDHQSGKASHGATLWSLLMFDAFLRRDAV